MINRFTQYYSGNQLFQHSDKILLAVSGGIDSMVLWRLFEEAGLNYAVAHCNFHLRGDDSNQDEAFVRERADELGVKLYVTHFDTQEYAAAAGISIEMAARRLRYDWFEETRRDGNFRWIATAHHLDDMLETFFINLVRKTGIRGLTGIKPKSGYLVRPLLFASRNEIEAFAQSREIEYRTDITNEDVVYQRNFIRHRIIPELEKLNPAFRNNLAETMENLRQAEEFNDYETARQIRKISDPQNSDEITVTSLLKQAFPDQLLFAWMTRYGFNLPSSGKCFHILKENPAGNSFPGPTAW
jgi:tRNA(Ile)-lysidine synthase